MSLKAAKEPVEPSFFGKLIGKIVGIILSIIALIFGIAAVIKSAQIAWNWIS